MFSHSFKTVFVALAIGIPAASQPTELRAKRGAELLNGYELRSGGKLFRRPADSPTAAFVAQLPLGSAGKEAKLAGVFDFDGDGQREVFLTWMTALPHTFVHHFQVYRIEAPGTILVGQFSFEGGPVAGIAFYPSQSTADAPKTVCEVMGGAKWGTWYLLSPDAKSTQELGSGAGYRFIDFEKSGTYSLVIYKERPFEPVCTFFGYMGLNPGLYPEVFRKDGKGYRQVWPPAGWLPYDFQLLDRVRLDPTPSLGRHYVVMAAIYDVDRDGGPEIVALTDTIERTDTARILAIYKLSGGSLILESQVAVAHPDMAVVIYGIRRLRETTQAVLLFADPRQEGCTGGAGIPSLTTAAGFDFRQGQFVAAWRRKFDQFYPYMPATLTGVDHTGEEELTFPDGAGSPFLTLRKESEFIPPPAKVLCAIGCPPFCTDAYTHGPPCGGNSSTAR